MKIRSLMHYYSVYGLTIASEFELPELPAVERVTETCDVRIRRGDVDPVPESIDGTGGRRIHADPEACRLSYESIGSFLIERGTRVVFDPISDDVVGTKIVRRLFENEVMGLVLHQRGVVVLHASAVSVDGKAAIFLGQRGAGKSTVAAAFHVRGYPILDDDVVGVRFDGESPMVPPGVPQLRLTPDAVDALGIDGVGRPMGDRGPQKHYRRTEPVPQPVPLARCYVLRWADELTLEEVGGHDAFLALTSRIYARGLLADTDATVDYFDRCAEVAETIPFRLLRRPKNYEMLPETTDLIVDDMRTIGLTDR